MTKFLAVFNSINLMHGELGKFSNSASCYFDGYLIRSVTVAHFTQVKDQQEAEKRKVTSQEIQESLQVPCTYCPIFGSLFVSTAVHCIFSSPISPFLLLASNT